MPEERPDRLNAVVQDLLKGKRLRVGPADADQRDAILAAARLAGSRDGYPSMSPAFRKRLEEMLERRRQPTVNRRSALVAGMAAAAGALGGVGISRVLGVSSGPGPAVTAKVPAQVHPVLVIDPRPGRWQEVAALTELPENQPVRVSGGAFNLFLVRQGDRVDALSTICSHLPCELQPVAGKGELLCPCHNASFDLRGQSLSETYPLPPLARGRVRIVAGRVQVMGT